MRVVVTGSTGLVGTALVAALQARGDRVIKLVRRDVQAADEAYWSPETGDMNVAVLEEADALVHLAGRSVNARWTETFKATMLTEREAGARLLCEAMARCATPPRVYLMASASGVYGAGAGARDETTPLADDWLARVGKVIEGPRAPAGTRKVAARLGVVLSPMGGALAEMLPAFRLGLGGPVGGGAQVMSWISLPDAVRALMWCVDQPKITGAVNVCAPENVTQRQLARALARALHRPALLPLPAFMVNLMFGEMGRTLLLQDWGMAPARLKKLGFEWQHPTLIKAFEALL